MHAHVEMLYLLEAVVAHNEDEAVVRLGYSVLALKSFSATAGDPSEPFSKVSIGLQQNDGPISTRSFTGYYFPGVVIDFASFQ